jgi:hypothetical protein
MSKNFLTILFFFPLIFFAESKKLKSSKYPGSPHPKPVILLYNYADNTQVDVRLTLNSTLMRMDRTFPEPEVNNNVFDWRVLAKLKGGARNKLMYHEEGYPYLFWEGTRLNDTPLRFERSFVFRRANVVAQMQDLLNRLGLNYEERADFITYWLRTLTQENYLQVSIVESAVYENFAHLELTPAPAHFLRVNLLLHPLKKAESVTENLADVVEVNRKGFGEDSYVVEWGAFLNK